MWPQGANELGIARYAAGKDGKREAVVFGGLCCVATFVRMAMCTDGAAWRWVGKTALRSALITTWSKGMLKVARQAMFHELLAPTLAPRPDHGLAVHTTTAPHGQSQRIV